MSKYPGRIVLKLEVVLSRGDKLIAGAVVIDISVSQCHGHKTYPSPVPCKTYISNVDFCLASKSASVNGRSNLALVRDTATRMPVSML